MVSSTRRGISAAFVALGMMLAAPGTGYAQSPGPMTAVSLMMARRPATTSTVAWKGICRRAGRTSIWLASFS